MKNIFLCAFAFVLFVTFGCGSGLPQGMPKLQKVKVTVTYNNGKPLANARITFLNTDSSLLRWNSSGTTDKNGMTILNTQGSYPGVPIETYKVVVEAVLSEGVPFPGQPSSEESAALYDEWKKNPEKRYRLINEIYEDRNKTTLQAEVKKGKQMFEFKVGEEMKTLISSILDQPQAVAPGTNRGAR